MGIQKGEKQWIADLCQTKPVVWVLAGGCWKDSYLGVKWERLQLQVFKKCAIDASLFNDGGATVIIECQSMPYCLLCFSVKILNEKIWIPVLFPVYCLWILQVNKPNLAICVDNQNRWELDSDCYLRCATQRNQSGIANCNLHSEQIIAGPKIYEGGKTRWRQTEPFGCPWGIFLRVNCRPKRSCLFPFPKKFCLSVICFSFKGGKYFLPFMGSNKQDSLVSGHAMKSGKEPRLLHPSLNWRVKTKSRSWDTDVEKVTYLSHIMTSWGRTATLSQSWHDSADLVGMRPKFEVRSCFLTWSSKAFSGG